MALVAPHSGFEGTLHSAEEAQVVGTQDSSHNFQHVLQNGYMKGTLTAKSDSLTSQLQESCRSKAALLETLFRCCQTGVFASVAI